MNLEVYEFTTPCPTTVEPTTSVLKAKQIMKELNVRHLPVVVDSEAVGIVSERDLQVVDTFTNSDTLILGKFMSKNPYSVRVKESIAEVALEMSRKKIGSAIVNNSDGSFYGIFTVTDALNALVEIVRGDILK